MPGEYTQPLYGVIRCTWINKCKDGNTLMLQVLLETNGKLGTVASFCGGGKKGSPPFVPEWCKNLGFKGELVELNRSVALAGCVVKMVKSDQGYWNLYAPWGKWAADDRDLAEGSVVRSADQPNPPPDDDPMAGMPGEEEMPF